MRSGGRDWREDETCRRFVLPALERAGWSEDQISDEYPITDGRILAGARFHERDNPLRADYALEYAPGLVIGIVEAKRTRKDAGDGIEQAKRYARLLDVPFAYATNGFKIYEVDRATGLITEPTEFPSPSLLWDRYRAAQGIDDGLDSELIRAPFNDRLRNWNNTPKVPRYYQRAAVNRALHAIARGDKRILLVLATGTGKTLVAFQIVAKLWQSRWTSDRRPRVLYLADRNVLVDQPKDDYFSPVFGEAVWKLGSGKAKRGRSIYFALYQSMEQGNEQTLFEAFPRDHFDLIIVDECHRGSAADSSQWRRILEHYDPAVQIGMTATPISDNERDTFGYFGNPIYTYSLAQGIEDGFLAPYRVRKVRLNVDMTGWRPDPGQRDIYGRQVPDNLYGPKEYERVLAILERTDEAANCITDIMRRAESPGRMGKTIVFCENNDHANRVRIALNNINGDMTRQYSEHSVDGVAKVKVRRPGRGPHEVHDVQSGAGTVDPFEDRPHVLDRHIAERDNRQHVILEAFVQQLASHGKGGIVKARNSFDVAKRICQQPHWNLGQRWLSEVRQVEELLLLDVLGQVPQAVRVCARAPVQRAADCGQPLLTVEKVVDRVTGTTRTNFETRDGPLAGEVLGALPQQNTADRIVPCHRIEQI